MSSDLRLLAYCLAFGYTLLAAAGAALLCLGLRLWRDLARLGRRTDLLVQQSYEQATWQHCHFGELKALLAAGAPPAVKPAIRLVEIVKGERARLWRTRAKQDADLSS